MTITDVEQLYSKTLAHLNGYPSFPDRDIRTTYFRNIINQCSVVHINWSINEHYLTSGSDHSRDLFNNDQSKVDNYLYHLSQNWLENIVEAALFQAELVFRALNAKLTGHSVYDGSTIPQLVAKLFSEIEPNWTKEESRLIILLFTGFRNTIHTGGIYFKNMTGMIKQYGGHDYQFTYGQPPTLPPGITLLDLASDLMDVMKSLFDSELIEAIGPLEHPNYQALGQ